MQALALDRALAKFPEALAVLGCKPTVSVQLIRTVVFPR